MFDPVYVLAPHPPKTPKPQPEFKDAIILSEFVIALPGERPVRDLLVAQILRAHEDKEKRVHAETVLTCAGALAGAAALYQSCVADIAPLMANEKLKEILSRHDGSAAARKTMRLIALLAADYGHLSVSRIINGGAVYAGAQTVCDPGKVLPQVEATVGTPRFGVPQVPPQHAPRELPRLAVDRLWSQTRNFLQSAQSIPGSWPLELAAAAQILMLRAKSVLSPSIAANLVLQSAVAMSMLDANDVGAPSI